VFALTISDDWWKFTFPIWAVLIILIVLFVHAATKGDDDDQTAPPRHDWKGDDE
jgi:hypothetical protein